jgi:GntR family transcriptional regulator
VKKQELALEIDIKSPEPAYRQIADQIRHWLVEGNLAAGEALPSVRRLAIELMVHHNTVAEAYRCLAEEGWLDLSQGKAAKVRERETQLPSNAEDREEMFSRFSRRLRLLIAEMRANGLPEEWIAAELVAQRGKE